MDDDRIVGIVDKPEDAEMICRAVNFLNNVDYMIEPDGEIKIGGTE